MIHSVILHKMLGESVCSSSRVVASYVWAFLGVLVFLSLVSLHVFVPREGREAEWGIGTETLSGLGVGSWSRVRHEVRLCYGLMYACGRCVFGICRFPRRSCSGERKVSEKCTWYEKQGT